jgi:hypothetical protein
MASKGKHKKRVKRTQASVCGEKTQYPSRDAANQMRTVYIAQGTYPDGVRVYRCQFCQYFHVGRIRQPDFRETKNRLSQWK